MTNGQVALNDRAVSEMPLPDLARLQEQIQQLQTQVEAMRSQMPDNRLAMVVFSGDLDRVLAAFVIA